MLYRRTTHSTGYIVAKVILSRVEPNHEQTVFTRNNCESGSPTRRLEISTNVMHRGRISGRFHSKMGLAYVLVRMIVEPRNRRAGTLKELQSDAHQGVR